MTFVGQSFSLRRVFVQCQLGSVSIHIHKIKVLGGGTTTSKQNVIINCGAFNRKQTPQDMFIRKLTRHFHHTVSNATRTEGNSDTSLYLQVYKESRMEASWTLAPGVLAHSREVWNCNASQGSVHYPLTSSYFPHPFPEDVYKSVLIQASVSITLIYPRPELEDFMV